MKNKEVWLEATHLFKSPTRNKSGIGNYTENIIKGIIDQNKCKDLNFSVVANLFFTNKKIFIAGIKSTDYSYLFTRFIPGKVWNLLLKKKLMPPIEMLHLKRPDLILNFDFTAVPTLNNTRVITVIHDLAFLKYPMFVEAKNLKRLKIFVPKAIEKSQIIVAISKATKQDLIKAYGIRPDRIEVVYCAVDRMVYKPTEITRVVKSRYNLPEKYMLYLGNIEPRKNILGIISAYEKLPKKITQRYKLVLAGGKGWNDIAIKDKINNSPLRKDIILTGYVEQKDIPAVYSAATVFLFPSFYEGFGLPIIESMACGTPVITADNSSLREVGGDAALYVRTGDDEQLSKKITELVEDKKLRDYLATKGQERANLFSWEKSSDAMLKVISKALEQ